MPEQVDIIRAGLEQATKLCHDKAVTNGWWSDPVTRQRIRRNKGELIALMHSELSEALEGERKGLIDKHLSHRRSAEVELADLLIRVFDYAGAHGYDLAGAVLEKLVYNDVRADHKLGNRLAEGGKKF